MTRSTTSPAAASTASTWPTANSRPGTPPRTASACTTSAPNCMKPSPCRTAPRPGGWSRPPTAATTTNRSRHAGSDCPAGVLGSGDQQFLSRCGAEVIGPGGEVALVEHGRADVAGVLEAGLAGQGQDFPRGE